MVKKDPQALMAEEDIMNLKDGIQQGPARITFINYDAHQRIRLYGAQIILHSISRHQWVGFFWDKGQRIRNSDGELAFTSFDRAFRVAELNRVFIQDHGGGFHPTQKPVKLYRWLLENYAQPGQLILDTHVGSASSLIACEQMGFDYVGYEIDEDYYKAAKNRMSKGIQLIIK